ncbi:hypothetical protein E2C01_047543 [Portunus trituberculatus]|uniref:Uncharacterized protein n=1 Tax=Portunus trituberculatus TaxID=210409 RepID=A0A5B7G884_PORTR|nr:hypothetical protein [Portunus trituberculatus]
MLTTTTIKSWQHLKKTSATINPLNNMVEEEAVSTKPGVLSGLPEYLVYEIITSPFNIFLSGIKLELQSST